MITDLDRLLCKKEKTINQLAEGIGVDPLLVLGWSFGTSLPGVPHIRAIARYLGVTVAEVLVAILGSCEDGEGLFRDTSEASEASEASEEHAPSQAAAYPKDDRPMMRRALELLGYDDRGGVAGWERALMDMLKLTPTTLGDYVAREFAADVDDVLIDEPQDEGEGASPSEPTERYVVSLQWSFDDLHEAIAAYYDLFCRKDGTTARVGMQMMQGDTIMWHVPGNKGVFCIGNENGRWTNAQFVRLWKTISRGHVLCTIRDGVMLMIGVNAKDIVDLREIFDLPNPPPPSVRPIDELVAFEGGDKHDRKNH